MENVERNSTLSDHSTGLLTPNSNSSQINEDEPRSVNMRPSMRQFLSEWALEHNITQSALNHLLLGLQRYGSTNIPKDARTLLKTSKSIESVSFCGGTYCNVGIERTLNAYLIALVKNKRTFPDNLITLDFNIDEVSCSKSTQSVLWLIQMGIRNAECNPFVIGVFQGQHKPKCNDFLKHFVDELNTLISKGLKYDNKLLSIELGYFCCDTPAVSFIRGSKGHTGFSSCVKCTQRGIYLDNRLVFPNITKSDRTHEDYINRMDPEHHIQSSVLETICGIDMIQCFPVDEMHIVHLGVVKKLVNFWNKKLNKQNIKLAETRIELAEKCRPKNEIRRQIRPLSEVTKYKAKEFRTILLFTGPIILKDLLETKYYNHFLILHSAMRKLSICQQDDIPSIQKLLEKFVMEFKILYGLNQVTYVVHSLIHLCDSVIRYGKPQQFSA